MRIIELLNLIAKEERKIIPDRDKLPTRIRHIDRDNNVREYVLSVHWEHGRNWIVYAEDNLPEDVWGELPIDSYNLNDEIEII